MDYITAMNNFLDIVEELPPNAIKLYLFLFKKANSQGCFKQGMTEYVLWVSLENLIGATGLNRKAIESARGALISGGVISYKQGSSHKRSEYTLNFYVPFYAPFHVQKEHENGHIKVQPNLNVNEDKIKEKKERSEEYKNTLYEPLPYEPTQEECNEIFAALKSDPDEAILFFQYYSSKGFYVKNRIGLEAKARKWITKNKTPTKPNAPNNYQQPKPKITML